MKIIVNKPKPVKVPPTTYDIVGLTKEELEQIKYAVGRMPNTDQAVELFSAFVCALRASDNQSGQ